MDKYRHDMYMTNKNYKQCGLVIARGSTLKAIIFDDTQITVFYDDVLGNSQVNYIHYEMLKNGGKIIID